MRWATDNIAIAPSAKAANAHLPAAAKEARKTSRVHAKEQPRTTTLACTRQAQAGCVQDGEREQVQRVFHTIEQGSEEGNGEKEKTRTRRRAVSAPREKGQPTAQY